MHTAIGGLAEAKLCIGDGYIYVYDSAIGGMRFADKFAFIAEEAVAKRQVPEFHFRIGVHYGLVRCFWDSGRNNWNYVGEGINGGQRVLSALGKERDDVVCLSDAVRSAVFVADPGSTLLPRMYNHGRKNDKHNNPWRVYLLNHYTRPGT